MQTIPDLLQPIISLAKNASEAILTIYQHHQQYQIQTKSDHSPVTQADLLAHKILIEGLSCLTPHIPILSEESLEIPWEVRQQWQTYWLIDPLDGTRQFIEHSGEFTVNIALIENHLPIFGLIYVPITEECYYAFPEAGAKKIDKQGQEQQISARTWQPNHTIILASRGANEKRLQERFGGLGEYSIVRKASAWKFCIVAEGQADISPRFGDTSEWDTAAGQCILEQAGGAILNLEGQPLRYNTRPSVLNPYFVALGDVESMYGKLPWGKWV